MPEMHKCNFHVVLLDHLKKKKYKNLKKQEIHDQSEQDKTCFQHDIAHGDFKDLTSS